MNHRILVVNDDPVQLHWIAETLRVRGREVTAFSRSPEAVEHLRGTAPPELIIVDLHMPELDGWKLCRVLRGPEFPHLAATPILVVSATFSGVDAEEVSRSLGANGFLPLPCTAPRLVSGVQDLLEGGGATDLPTLLVAFVGGDEGDDRVLSGFPSAVTGFRVRNVAESESVLDALDWAAPEVVVLCCGSETDAVVAAVRAIRARFSPPVVLVARPSGVGGAVELLRSGADALLPLPLDAEELGELVARARRERALLRVEDVLEARTRELRGSERKMRGILSCIPDGILALDRHLRVVEFNRAARVLLPGCEAPGFRLLDAVLREDVPTLEAGVAEAARGGTSSFRVRVLGGGNPAPADGGMHRVLEVRGAPHGSGPGEEVLLLLRDLTEPLREAERQRTMERRLEHTQRLESLGVMAGGIAHDFNNLLVAILGYAGLARIDAPPHSDLEEYLWQVETAARRASDLTEQILTFSGQAPVELVPVELGSLVREMTSLLGPAIPSRAALVIEGDREGLRVMGDPSQLRQILMNLVMNGAEALGEEGGRVVVRTRAARPGEVERAAGGPAVEPDRGMVCLEVEDDGAGMDPTTQNRIFEPFFTTKAEGRGLGLAAMAGIVRAHGGSVAVDSTPGEGTCFRVFIPEATPGSWSGTPAAPAARSTARAAMARGSVLVVDAEASIRTLASDALRRVGLETRDAGGGLEALRILGEFSDVGAIVLDLSMPGLDGKAFLEAMAAMGIRIPVVLSSGYTRMDPRVRALEDLVHAFLPKPYGPHELVQSLREARHEADRRHARGLP